MNDLLVKALPLAEAIIVKRDFELLKKIAIQMKPELQMQLTPYTALLCYEAINYLKRKGSTVNIEQTSKYSIKDIRQKAKFFDLSINKLLQSINNVDRIQNEYYKRLLRYKLFGKLNLYYNIGVWFDENKNIVGNTHYAYYVFQEEKIISKPTITLQEHELADKEIEAFAFDMGCIIGGACKGLSAVNDYVYGDFTTKDILISSRDFNTNRWKSKENKPYKTIRIFLLHVLSNIGFIIYILKKCIVQDTGILLRLEYITYHYVLEKLDGIKKFCDNSNLFKDKNLVDALNSINYLSRNELWKSEFRNCMMHFELKTNEGVPLIEESKLDLSIPFCGLVESQFEGMTYDTYKNKIEKELIGISESLKQYLDLSIHLT